MFDKKIVARILVLFTREGRNTFDKRMTHPRREWFIGLAVFSLLIIAGGIESAHVFFKYQNLRADNGKHEQTIIQYSEVLANNARITYTQRKERFLALQQNTPVIFESSSPVATTSSAVATSTDILIVPGTDVVE